MFCKNCGKELPENAKFCSSCGTPVVVPVSGPPQDLPGDEIPPVGAEPIPDGAVSSDSAASGGLPAEETVLPAPATGEGAPPPEDPLAVRGPAYTGSQAPPDGPAVVLATKAAQEGSDIPGPGSVKRRGKAGLAAVAGVAGVLAIVLIVLAVKLVGGLVGGGGAAAYAYLTEDGELMYLANLKEKTEALELTDEADLYTSYVQISPNGKTVYFTDQDNTLYTIAVSELKKGGKPERISRDVGSFFLLKDGRLIYREDDGGESKLNLYDGKEHFRLIKDYDDYRLGEDQKTIYYTQRDDTDDTLTLYKMAIAKDAKEERLLKGATSIYSDWDASMLIYGQKETGYAGDNTITVYSCTPGGDKTKLVSDVCSVTGVKTDGGKADFYYYVQNVEKHTLYDFVTDTKASADAATLSGEEPEYPSWSDYSPREYYIAEDDSVFYTDRFNNQYTIDVSSVLVNGRTVDDLYTWDVSPIANKHAQARYDKAVEDYEAQSEIWYAAKDREQLREGLKKEQYDQIFYTLYHYTGSGKGEAIAEEISPSNCVSASYDGVFLYRKISLDGGKVADMADLDYVDDLYALFEDGDGEWYQNVGGKESVIDLDGVTGISSLYVLNGKELVMDAYEADDHVVRSYALGEDTLTFTTDIFDGECSMLYRGNTSGKDVLYLFTDTEKESDYITSGDFCVYRDGELETIAKDVYGAAILDKSGSTYLISDIDEKNNTTELSILKDGKPSTIADEIARGERIIFLDSTRLLYISDGDLCLFDGKEERRIARDVVDFWASAAEEYSVYYPYF